MKQKQKSILNYRNVKICAGIVIGLLLVAQITFDVLIYRRNGDDLLISTLMIRAVEGLHKPAVIEPITGDVYLTDAKLKLPASSERYIIYRYYEGTDFQAEEVSISDNQILNELGSKLISTSQSPYGGRNTKNVFDQIPNLQACSRGVHIRYEKANDQGSGFKLEFTKKLNNGRKIYIYTEKKCNTHLLPDIVEYTKLIQSY